MGTTMAFSETSVWKVTSANIPESRSVTSAGTVRVTVYSLVWILAGPLHGTDGGGEVFVNGADIYVRFAAGVQLGHQRLGDGDGDLHLVRAVNDRQRHGVGNEAVFHGVHGHQCAGHGGDDVAVRVHVFQRGIQLFQAGFGILDPGLQLGQGGVPPATAFR